MRHRMGIAACTGLGNPDSCLLGNQWSDNEKLNAVLKSMFDEAIAQYFKKYGGLDFHIESDGKDFNICMGIEPAYMYDKLNVINICSRKEKSSHQTGISFGAYGSGIRSTCRRYADFKNKAKFIQFIDKWHPQIVEALGA